MTSSFTNYENYDLFVERDQSKEKGNCDQDNQDILLVSEVKKLKEIDNCNQDIVLNFVDGDDNDNHSLYPRPV